MELPDKIGRTEILQIYLAQLETESDIAPEQIAGMTAGMVARIWPILSTGRRFWPFGGIRSLGMAEIEEAVERVVAGLEKKNRLINPEEKKIVAYYEFGHAIVTLAFPGTDAVQKISIIPCGIAALGYTMQVPSEDRRLMRKTDLNNRIAAPLEGRAAEGLILSNVSTGVHNDLSRAKDTARSMVKEYGMSTRLGQS